MTTRMQSDPTRALHAAPNAAWYDRKEPHA